ncbi:DNA sulfur modification protein DndE [Endozoicomonas atrinae]|uniref:DNA sulfur modification protein DndE n=1 Tax=Endozoicomonas atrinae TaxID=1333660 RepID=UPI000824669E|nr:DNA sulfur modification protein DndE [Endozoicomonas atrinae]
MLPNRIRISKKATDTLTMIKGRTGLTPNILCRLAIAHALESGSLRKRVDSNQDGQEFNTNTLLGEHAELYAMLIRQQVRGEELGKVVAQLVDDGMGLFSGVNNLSDLFVKCKGKVE